VRIGGTAACLAAIVALMGAAPAAADYVALGDSYAAGPLIPAQLQPFGCLKSSNNYAHLAAPQLHQPAFRDATCSGAETEDMTAPQGVTPGPNPPQFDSLDADTQIVTFNIGGNDIGFSSIAEDCASLFSPAGTPCQDRFVVDGHDEISERIAATAPKVAAVLQGIHQRSPAAKVLVVAYAAILPETGSGCWPQVPLSFSDVPYLRQREKNLNTMLRNQAAVNGATYVDDYTPSIGHDACKSSGTRWVEPLVPGNAAAPFHPNARGEAGVAAAVTPLAR
jgi:hypothetical protein